MTDPTQSTTRRRALLGGAALAAGALTAPALLPSRAHAAVGGFSVATYNIEYKLTDADFYADLAEITSRAQVIGLNEVWQRSDLAATLTAQGWDVVHPMSASDATSGTNAVAARADQFARVNAGSELIGDPNGPTKTNAIYLTWAHWRHRGTGMEFVHLNTHLPPGIESMGSPAQMEVLPETGTLDDRIGVAYAAIQRVWDIADFCRQGRGADGRPVEVIASGDLNIDHARDRAVGHPQFPWRQWERGRADSEALRSVYSLTGVKGEGTHGENGGRHIDAIYHWRRVESLRRLGLTDYSILGRQRSDHRAVIAQYEIRS